MDASGIERFVEFDATRVPKAYSSAGPLSGVDFMSDGIGGAIWLKQIVTFSGRRGQVLSGSRRRCRDFPEKELSGMARGHMMKPDGARRAGSLMRSTP
jgi:hypothetical protein